MRESSFIVWCEGLLIAVTPKQAQNALTVAMSATTVSVSRLFFADLPLRETGQRLRSPGCFTLPLDGWKVSCASPPLQQQLSCAERSLPFEYPSHTHIHTHTHIILVYFCCCSFYTAILLKKKLDKEHYIDWNQCKGYCKLYRVLCSVRNSVWTNTRTIDPQ